jgi:hypothetical protein
MLPVAAVCGRRPHDAQDLIGFRLRSEVPDDCQGREKAARVIVALVVAGDVDYAVP